MVREAYPSMPGADDRPQHDGDAGYAGASGHQGVLAKPYSMRNLRRPCRGRPMDPRSPTQRSLSSFGLVAQRPDGRGRTALTRVWPPSRLAGPPGGPRRSTLLRGRAVLPVARGWRIRPTHRQNAVASGGRGLRRVDEAWWTSPRHAGPRTAGLTSISPGRWRRTPRLATDIAYSTTP